MEINNYQKKQQIIGSIVLLCEDSLPRVICYINHLLHKSESQINMIQIREEN